MITLRAQFEPNSGYYVCPAIGYAYGSNPVHYMLRPKSLLEAAPLTGSPWTAEAEIPFGTLTYPSRMRWGALRDRDVVHVNAVGALDLNQVTLSSLRTPYVPGPNMINHGRAVVIGGVTCQYSDVSRWGVNYSNTASFSVQPWNDVAYGWCKPFTVNYSSGVQYEGNKAIVWSIRHDHTVYWGSGVFHTHHLDDLSAYIVERTYSPDGRAKFAYRALPVYGLKLKHVITGVLSDPVLVIADLDQYRTSPYIAIAAKFGVTGAVPEIGLPALFEEIRARLSSQTLLDRVLLEFKLHPCLLAFGDLTEDLLSQIRFVDTNLLLTGYDLLTLQTETAVWKDFFQLVSLVRKSGRQGFRNLSHLIQTLSRGGKKTSGMFLGYKYAILPTVSDGTKVLAGLGRLLNDALTQRRIHGRRQTIESSLSGPISTTSVLTTEVSHFPMGLSWEYQKYVGFQHRLGIWPDLTTAWDAIPFSFVLDWVVDIGSLVEAADAKIWVEYFPISYCIMGRKRSWYPTLESLYPDLGCTGTVEFTHYTRMCGRDLPLPPIQVRDENAPFEKWGEATALAIVRNVR